MIDCLQIKDSFNNSFCENGFIHFTELSNAKFCYCTPPPPKHCKYECGNSSEKQIVRDCFQLLAIVPKVPIAWHGLNRRKSPILKWWSTEFITFFRSDDRLNLSPFSKWCIDRIYHLFQSYDRPNLSPFSKWCIDRIYYLFRSDALTEFITFFEVMIDWFITFFEVMIDWISEHVFLWNSAFEEKVSVSFDLSPDIHWTLCQRRCLPSLFCLSPQKQRDNFLLCAANL